MPVPRKYFYFGFVLILITGLVGALLVSPPRSWNDSEPPGWPNKYPEKSLQGMIAAANRLSHEIWVSPPFNSYVVAYASAAYWDAYRATSEEDSIFGLPSTGKPSSDAGVTAFSRVFYELVPVPAVKQFADKYDSGNKRGIEAANSALSQALQENFVKTPKTYQEILAESGVSDFDETLVWLPSNSTGPVTEPAWGETVPIFTEVLDCTTPPPAYDVESLQNEAEALVRNNRDAIGTDGSNYPLITSLYAAYFPRPANMSSNVTLALDNILSNMVDDSGIVGREADRALLQYAITVNDMRIVLYRDKYLYRVPSIQAFTDFMTIDFPYHPSYPSEPAALINGLKVIASDNYLESRPRLEVAGNMISQPWNRVLASLEDLGNEIEALSYLAGTSYTFDLKPGSDLGTCTASVVSEALSEKGI